MADQKIFEFVSRLYNRSQEGKVPWEKTVQDDTFQATFSQGFSVQIEPRPPQDPTDIEADYWVTILNDAGETVEQFNDVSLRDTSFNGKTSWTVLKEIHTIARRRAMGSERAIDAIMADLGEDEDLPF